MSLLLLKLFQTYAPGNGFQNNTSDDEMLHTALVLHYTVSHHRQIRHQHVKHPSHILETNQRMMVAQTTPMDKS